MATDHLAFDSKSTEQPLLEAVWELLGEYESRLTTAPKTPNPSNLAPFDAKPILAITDDSDAQEEVFFRPFPPTARLRLFGSAYIGSLSQASRQQRAHPAATLPPEVHSCPTQPRTTVGGGITPGGRSKKVARPKRANGLPPKTSASLPWSIAPAASVPRSDFTGWMASRAPRIVDGIAAITSGPPTLCVFARAPPSRRAWISSPQDQYEDLAAVMKRSGNDCLPF